MKRVLLVIDMQNDFVDGALGTAEAVAIVPKVAERIRRFDGPVYMTMDTHTEQYPDTQEGRRLPVPHCATGTHGWAPAAAVWEAMQQKCMADEAHVVMKGGFGAPDLPIRLKDDIGEDIDEITLIGLCTDICVIANAFVLKTFFPEARVVVDASCCAGVTPESHENALAAMRACQFDIE